MCNTTPTNMGALTLTAAWQNVNANSGAKRYWTFNATAGCTYDFSTCNSVNTNDTYLRLYSGTNPLTAVLQTFNDDNGPFCATTKASLSWVCPTSGAYSILVTNYSCANISSNSILSYRETCSPPWNPCTTIPTITCGTTINLTVASGNGIYNPPATSCGFTTPGKEYIYSFTPTVTGNYNISQPTSFGYIDYFWKPASGGCNGTGWTCIDDITNGNVGNASINIPLSAGTTYYIMLDPESNTGGSVSWQISCPTAPWNPCTTIPTITCGTTINLTVAAGTGLYNPPTTSCGFTTPGNEYIYSFTPTVTGNYTISQPTSFGYIDYFYKPASGGCNGTGWTCIDDITTGNIGNANVNIPLTAGTTYYIMLDPESNLGGSVTWSLNCITAPVGNDACATATAISSLPYTSPVTSNSTSTDDVPTSASNCGTQGSNLWYTVVGNGNQLTASTCNVSTDFDTEVRVYTGNCTSINSMVEVDCEDDDAACSINGLHSTAIWCSSVGVTYYISVGYFASGPGYGNFVLTVNNGGPCTILPIELLDFVGINSDEGYNYLYWSTATEINNDYFTLERSLDAISWQTIATKTGAGNSTSFNNYDYKDYQYIRDITNYYRLSQTDFNGHKEFFKIISVNSENLVKCSQFEYFDLLGNRVDLASSPAGVYLRKCNLKIDKIIKVN